MTKVTVVIVNWNGAQNTINCIRSLQAMEAEACELSIVVTDNGSTDGSYVDLTSFLLDSGYVALPCETPANLKQRIKGAASYTPAEARFPTVTLIAATKNNGFAAGNNVAIELSSKFQAPDFFWFLNNDTVVDRNALSALLHKMNFDPNLGICGSTLLYESDRRTVQAYGGALYSMYTGRAWAPGAGLNYDPAVTDEWAEQRVNYVAGAAMLVRASLFEEIGLMSEDYFLYNEEIDLALRASDRFRLGVATKSIVYHRVGASIGTEGPSVAASRLAAFYQARSKLLFASRHTRRFYPLVWLALAARGIKCLVNPRRTREAVVILQVLFGRRGVDPSWFDERQSLIARVSSMDTAP